MTIENLTSFHSVTSNDKFLIYPAGFHNSVRKEFIKKNMSKIQESVFIISGILMQVDFIY
jgi:hypothetical protein